MGPVRSGWVRYGPVPSGCDRSGTVRLSAVRRCEAKPVRGLDSGVDNQCYSRRGNLYRSERIFFIFTMTPKVNTDYFGMLADITRVVLFVFVFLRLIVF